MHQRRLRVHKKKLVPLWLLLFLSVPQKAAPQAGTHNRPPPPEQKKDAKVLRDDEFRNGLARAYRQEPFCFSPSFFLVP